jgi:hypothetical protein
MLPSTIYGYADNADVESAIQARMQSADANSKEGMAELLGQAVFALLEINSAIPVQSKHRHLIANSLENFADGPRTQDPHTES